jgi:phosphoserine phosphatase RsbX
MAAMNTGGEIALGRCGLSLSWAVLAYAKHHDQPCGDGYAIRRNDDRILFAVADGAGSGTAAAQVAELCLSSLEGSQGTIESDFRRCHAALQGGRGAAMALVAVSTETGVITWASVGDVDGLLLRNVAGRRKEKAAITQIGGTLGITFNGVAPQSHRLLPGDLLVLTTDGVLRDFAQKTTLNHSAERSAQRILQDFSRPNDDSLVLAIEVVAR